jgi:MraZ protein
MFLGRFQHTIDSKGRLSIPVRFREILREKYEETLVVTADIDQCLVAFPPDEWRSFVERTKQAPNMQKEVK